MIGAANLRPVQQRPQEAAVEFGGFNNELDWSLARKRRAKQESGHQKLDAMNEHTKAALELLASGIEDFAWRRQPADQSEEEEEEEPADEEKVGDYESEYESEDEVLGRIVEQVREASSVLSELKLSEQAVADLPLQRGRGWPAEKLKNLRLVAAAFTRLTDAVMRARRLVPSSKGFVQRGDAQQENSRDLAMVKETLEVLVDSLSAFSGMAHVRAAAEELGVPLRCPALLKSAKAAATTLFAVFGRQAYAVYMSLSAHYRSKFDLDARALSAHRLLTQVQSLKEQMAEHGLIDLEQIELQRQLRVREALETTMPLALIVCVLGPYCSGNFDVQWCLDDLRENFGRAIRIRNMEEKWDKVETVTLRRCGSQC